MSTDGVGHSTRRFIELERRVAADVGTLSVRIDLVVELVHVWGEFKSAECG